MATPNKNKPAPNQELNQILSDSGISTSTEMLNVVMTKTIGMLMHNAITEQQRGQMLGSAAANAACSQILAIGKGKEAQENKPGNTASSSTKRTSKPSRSRRTKSK